MALAFPLKVMVRCNRVLKRTIATSRSDDRAIFAAMGLTLAGELPNGTLATILNAAVFSVAGVFPSAPTYATTSARGVDGGFFRAIT